MRSRLLLPWVIVFGWFLPSLQAENQAGEERVAAPRAEPVRPASRISAADLELVKQVFQKKQRRPMDLGRDEELSDLDATWQSYWWGGEDALFNTKGLVITGQTDWGPDWKPYGLLGLEEQVTFERYGKYRHAHVGFGIKYAFTTEIGSFLEFRARSSSAMPQEGLMRLGMHFSY
ncbi:MAG: hypothetical protein AAF649_10900 [Verrucomicrobiota bacterium]